MDPFGRDAPRGLVAGLIDVPSAGDVARAAALLAPPEGIALRGSHLERMEAALDAGGRLLPLSELRVDPDGVLDDGLAPDRERIGTLVVAEAEVDLLALRDTPDARGDEAGAAADPGPPVWRLAPERAAALLAVDARGLATRMPLWDALALVPEGPEVMGAALRDRVVLLGFGALARCVASGLVALRGLVGQRVTRASPEARLAAFSAILLHALEVDITAGPAALGVGGLAVALGARKPMENLIGSVTLIADRPVRVGDFRRSGQTPGTVEEIGIRSTRIRILGRTVVAVPDGALSNLHLGDFAHRDRFLIHHAVGLTYDTAPRTMRAASERLRHVLHDHPQVLPEPARVRLVGLAAASRSIEIFAYIRAEDWNDHFAVQEELILSVMDAVEAVGAAFAFPTRTLQVERTGERERTSSRSPVVAR